jgi:hypothetical protein
MTINDANYAIFSSAAVADAKNYLNESTETNLLLRSLKRLEIDVDHAIKQPIDVPGQGEAGSYEHNQHKSNYELMDQCGKLYTFTGDPKYLNTIRNLLVNYADVYLQMPFHEQKNTNPPGRLFHQILNEHMWLFYASLAYSAIKESIPKSDQEHIESQLFRPMIEMFTVYYGHDFDRIHNHGLWAVAAVGLCGLVVNDLEATKKSIYGLLGDGTTGGYLAQISQLFSASGYYIEGPYYHRFAIRPLVIFAEALHLHFPELDIYNYNDKVIGNTIKALLLTSNPDGTFPALNDASLTMNINDEGALAALSVYFARYGDDPLLTAAAKQQDTIWLSPCSVVLSRSVDAFSADGSVRWPSIELTEGAEQEKGGQGFLRSQSETKPVTQAIMGYGQHGMGHGHFDALGITLFANGHEFLREYGFGRWVNVETKFGGRYLDENKSWARQTIAHNGVTVDQTTQNNFDHKLADTHTGTRHFFTTQHGIQAMSAYANEHYKGVMMQRTIAMVEHEDFENPLVLDIYRLASENTHQYDFSVHYRGQVTSTNLEYQYHNTQRNVLGDNYGYQHLFETASAPAKPTSTLTWLQDNCFHSWSTSAVDANMVFAQTGANDPAMNLRTEDCFILRTQGDNHTFASAYETHGLFDEASERCYGALNQISEVEVVHSDDAHTLVRYHYQYKSQTRTLLICIANKLTSDEQSKHSVQVGNDVVSWTGYITLLEGSAS